jgi:predicted nucleic acid-binding protein
MSDKTFADTNILVYAFSRSELEKQAKALAVLDECDLVVSAQVIREFISVATRKYNQPISKIIAHVNHISDISDIVDEDIELIRSAIELHQHYSYRFYDCLIIAAALKADCKILLSEDMQSGQTIGTLTIVNPFV